ncbi:hypothetical protein Q73_05490 [Bacillus coahuilensis m2-6]|uniref:KH domain-containing protein n=1 Tax=Bacillus coahuilensis TaxID=408580 RepID=UPI0001850E82|nr:KH domain-containing protein [Bacillus coahuilensis]KUP08642.1 hypothetical protein Q73_05490 [Bacillus coahuilensis m2-6]
MKSLILAIVQPIVDHPDHVQVVEEVDEDKVLYRLSVHEEDMGRVIGKQGRTAKAIRALVNTAASSKQKKMVIEITG